MKLNCHIAPILCCSGELEGLRLPKKCWWYRFHGVGRYGFWSD